MFNNIGRKIKLCAELVTWIGIIISILTGIILMITDGTFNGFFIGLLYCIIGPLACWVSAFVLYGFGQLIENSDILVKALAPEQNKSTNVNIKQISIVESERINISIPIPTGQAL